MNISRPFIKRPIATTLLSAALLLAGAAGYSQLPVAPLPRVDFPTINVGGALPGASPETMASSVATPLERRFGRIAGVNEMTSTSSFGATSLTLQFDLERDVDAAGRDVQAAINAAGGDLPANLPTRPNYRKFNPADASILILSLTSNTVPLGEVFDAANTILAQRIAQVTGVGQVFVGGGQQPAVRVQVDPVALAGVGLTLEDVRAKLAASTVDPAKGAINGPLARRTLQVNDQLFLADQYKSLIMTYVNGAPVRLKDVANVLDDVENARVAAWTDDQRAVLIIVRRQPGANIIEVIKHIEAILPQLVQSISPAIKVSVALDRSQTIRGSVDDVQFSLLISVVLVVLVVFAFLRSVWATAIPSIAVPLSLIATFGVMYLFGYSLDNLSLMALTISTGFVVDDAIVVTENITRFIEAGDRPLIAALKGAKQIGFTIVSISVSLIAVFIPILLMSGIIGRLFREFAVTLSIAIVVSALLSLTLTPMMCSRLLRSHGETKHGRVYNLFESLFDTMLHVYERGLKWVLAHRHVVLGVTLATIFGTLGLYVIVPWGFFPQQDTGQLQGSSEAPQDISFPAMKKRQEAVNAVVFADPAVDHMISFIGSGGGGNVGNTGSMFVALKPLAERKVSADEIVNRLRPKLAKVEGIKMRMQAVQDVRIGGRGSQAQYQYTLQDANLDELNQWAPRVYEKLSTLPQLKDVNSDQQTEGLQLDVTVDRDSAARLGISMADIDNTIYDAFGQRQIAAIYKPLNQYRVVLEVTPAYQKGPAAINSLFVRSQSGGQVPLSALVKAQPSSTSLSINHQSQFPATTISFNLSPGIALGQAVDAIHQAELEIGLPASVHADFQGTAQAFQSSRGSMLWLLLAALFTVYIVLGVLYESYIHPITILSTLPSAGVGAFLALKICGIEFTLIALIGMILLIGIVKKNAIMMIDFALEAERTEGLSAEESIYKACVLRFRPIMMTTMAALFGGLPLALGHGLGAEVRRPLGVAIVGGLIVSQMLTLFTTPVVYLALDRFSRRKRGKWEADGRADQLDAADWAEFGEGTNPDIAPPNALASVPTLKPIG